MLARMWLNFSIQQLGRAEEREPNLRTGLRISAAAGLDRGLETVLHCMLADLLMETGRWQEAEEELGHNRRLGVSGIPALFTRGLKTRLAAWRGEATTHEAALAQDEGTRRPGTPAAPPARDRADRPGRDPDLGRRAGRGTGGGERGTGARRRRSLRPRQGRHRGLPNTAPCGQRVSAASNVPFEEGARHSAAYDCQAQGRASDARVHCCPVRRTVYGHPAVGCRATCLRVAQGHADSQKTRPQ